MESLTEKKPKRSRFGFNKNLAATYSRGSYTTTTIGKAAFDGRVRNGNGSDHSFMATKKLFADGRCSIAPAIAIRKPHASVCKEHAWIRIFSENYT
jgi:hypothetical protein